MTTQPSTPHPDPSDPAQPEEPQESYWSKSTLLMGALAGLLVVGATTAIVVLG